MSSDDKRMSSVAATVLMVLVGLALVYYGLRLANTSIFFLVEGGPVLLAVGLGVVGIVMVVAPVLVLLSQLRAWVRKRQSDD